MKSKILLTPTYFPTAKNKIVGSQIKEQFESLSEMFDVKVLYCLPGMGWKRFILQIFFGRLLKNFGYKSCKEFLSGGTLDTYGIYYFRSSFLPENVNRYLFKRAYSVVVKQLIKSNWKPDILASRGFNYGGLAALSIYEEYHIPYIHTENTAFLFDKNFSLYNLSIYKQVLKNAKKLIFVSNFLLRNTLKHGFLQKVDCVVIGNPIDEKLFYPKPKKSTETKYLLITGYSSYIKDFRTFFKALKLVVNKGHINVKAKIAMTYKGTNGYNELLDMVKYYGLENYCEIFTEVHRSKMPDLINSCDIFVSTSIIETFGIAMLEALFCGKPIVSTKNGGVDEFITKDNGIVCDVQNHVEIAEAISTILEGDIKFNSKLIRESVIDRFNMERYISKMTYEINDSLH